MRGVTLLWSALRPVFPKFQLTRLMRGVTNFIEGKRNFETISTHTPHARRDPLSRIYRFRADKFQLTRLMRGVTDGLTAYLHASANFNSHASCEA